MNPYDFQDALQDFHRAHARAGMQQVLGRLTRKSKDLLAFDEVTRKLRTVGSSSKGLRDIPVDAIIGSVNRNSDYTRDFLPIHVKDKNRWARVKTVMVDPGSAGFPPIEVYKIGEVYFVQDGHHRVSVARQLKMTYIQAYVTEVKTKVPLTPDVQPQDLIIKAEKVDFLNDTHFDELIPGVDLEVTLPGLFPLVSQHIRIHRYYMGIDNRREIPINEAVKHWYEVVYLPVVKIIREEGLLREFRGRTETDLYVSIVEHRGKLETKTGWRIRTTVAASDFAGKMSPRIGRVVQRVVKHLVDSLLPDELEDETSAAYWMTRPDNQDNLFCDILVPINGRAEGWLALEQALLLSAWEGGQVNGLYVIRENTGVDSLVLDELKNEFQERCQKAGVKGALSVVAGEVTRTVIENSLLNDMILLNLAYPPGQGVRQKLESGIRTILRKCSRPVVVVPGVMTALDHLLLAYDGSPKAKEALYICAYIALRRNFGLTVLVVGDSINKVNKQLNQARVYLESRHVSAEFITKKGDPARAILDTVNEKGVNLLVTGGYGLAPVFELVAGSTLDLILRECPIPMMICQ